MSGLFHWLWQLGANNSVHRTEPPDYLYIIVVMAERAMLFEKKQIIDTSCKKFATKSPNSPKFWIQCCPSG